MEGLIGGLIGIVIAQFSLLWYKIGRVEQRVRDISSILNGGKDGRDKNGDGPLQDPYHPGG